MIITLDEPSSEGGYGLLMTFLGLPKYKEIVIISMISILAQSRVLVSIEIYWC